MNDKASNPNRTAPLWLVIAAFAAVYVVWGSTYLGIRLAVDTMPPFLLAGMRHLSAGVLLFAFARFRGAAAPKLIEWRDATLAGALMLLIGNGGVTWAEKTIPSAVAALVAALVPVWIVLLDWSRRNGKRPNFIVTLGLVAGIAGVAVLTSGRGARGGSNNVWGMVALLAASLGWASGSVFNRSAKKPASPFLGVSMQMIAGGLLLLVLAAGCGEFQNFSPARVTAVSFFAWLYLAIAGSLITYTAYIWLIHVTSPALVATNAYVNPLIAVLLGCTVGHEKFTGDMAIAGVLIILAVVFIIRGQAVKPTDTGPIDDVG